MTKKPQHKKHIRMIEFEPANDFQEELWADMFKWMLRVLKSEIESRHQKNKFTIKYMTKENPEVYLQSI